MPIYNGVEYIDESVSSILAQTYTEWELIIGVDTSQCKLYIWLRENMKNMGTFEFLIYTMSVENQTRLMKW